MGKRVTPGAGRQAPGHDGSEAAQFADFLRMRLADAGLLQPEAAVFIRAAIRLLSPEALDTDRDTDTGTAGGRPMSSYSSVLAHYIYALDDVSAISPEAGTLLRSAIRSMESLDRQNRHFGAADDAAANRARLN